MLMNRLGVPRLRTVNVTGADTGCILVGVASHNRGLRIRILRPQARNSDGPIQGRFQILDAGDNRHAPSLEPLLGKVVESAEVLRITRHRYPQTVNIVNAQGLVVETG